MILFSRVCAIALHQRPVDGELQGVPDLARDVDDGAVQVEHGTGEELVLPNLLLAVKRFRFFSKPVLGSTVYHFGMVKQACIISQLFAKHFFSDRKDVTA